MTGRLSFAALLGALLLLLLVRLGPSLGPGARGAASAFAAERPNIVIVLVDTLRADHLGLYGYGHDTSPVLDKWAKEAVVFDQAYAPTSWTKPSVVSLFSGLNPLRHGVEDRLDLIPESLGLLSEELKARGYSTFAAVTNPNVLPQWGFARGFDVYEDLDSAGHDTRAGAVADWLEERVDELGQSEPFLLYLHLLDPHAPYEPPPPFDERFPRSGALPEQLSVGAYDGEIAYVDSQFGRILDLLASRGLADDSLVFFVSDHGEELLDHGRMGHGYSLHEEVIRIPMVMRLPGGEHGGTRVEARSSLTDVLPTILGLLGEEPRAGLDGSDLRGLLVPQQPRWTERELLLSLRTTGEDGHLVRGLLSGAHKYLRRSVPVAEESLFDLASDPAESENLAEELGRLRAQLSRDLDGHVSQASSGVHLRLVHASAGEAVGCFATLRTAGRFVQVSPLRLETGDSVELSDDGRTLRLKCTLENRFQRVSTGERLVPDEDGLVFSVDPPDALIEFEQLGLTDGSPLTLMTASADEAAIGASGFRADDEALWVRDALEPLGPGASAATAPLAILGVVRPAPRRETIPPEMLERLRALGYVGG